MTKPDTLTPKQEAFALAIVEGLTQTAAYKRAGYKGEGHSAEVAACRLLKNVKVSARIDELKGAARERHGVTVDDLAVELEEARALARDKEQPAAMVSATMGKAKLYGLGGENVQVAAFVIPTNLDDVYKALPDE